MAEAVIPIALHVFVSHQHVFRRFRPGFGGFMTFRDELMSVSNNGRTTTFAYDAAGIRVKTVAPNGMIIDYPFPGYEVESPTSNPTVRITFAIAGQAVVLKVMGSSTNTYYLYNDHLGSTSTMSTTAGGTVTGSTSRYYPFGDWRTEPTANLTDRGFTGHLHHNIGNAPDDIGLVYMQARWYLPGLARFISADSIIPNPANPQSYNRYAYVRNSPLNFSDPTGHRECGAHDGCSGEALPPRAAPPPPLGDPLEGFYDIGFDYDPDPTRPKPEEGQAPSYHNGVDLGNDEDTADDLFAIAVGRVRVADACTVCGNTTSTDANYGTGNVVIIEYVYDVIPANIRDALGLKKGESVYVQYQHLASIDESITIGQAVQLGDVIGQYGNTGRSEGAHLHLEVHIGAAGALGRGTKNVTNEDSYNTHNAAWHKLSIVDPGLIWNIPQPPN